MLNKDIELTVKISEDAKEAIDCNENFSLSKSVKMEDITIDMDIDSEELYPIKKVIYKLYVVITNKVNNKEVIERFSMNFQEFDEICKTIMITCTSLNICYNLMIEVDYKKQKYLNYFEDLRLGYIKTSDLIEYVIHTNLKKNKNLLKLCDLIIYYDYYFVSNEDIQFILDKLYYYGFNELEKDDYTENQVIFKSSKELLQSIVGTTIDILINMKNYISYKVNLDWLNTIYIKAENQLLLENLINN